MRVALLSHSAQSGDAIGRQLAEKAAFFLDRGADVRLFVETDRRLHNGLRPHTSRFAPPEPRGPHWRFLTSADLIVVEYSQYFALLELLPLLAGGRPRILFDYHCVTPPEFAAANHRDLLERGQRLRGLVWYADAAIAHCRFAWRELIDGTAFPAELTHQLGYAVDGKWFAPGQPAAALRQQLNLPAGSQLLLFVGRVAPNKRVTVLIEAVARLRERLPPVHAVIVGDSGDCYEPERQRCRERAARLGVSNRVHFLGHVDENGLRDAYRDADVLVLPSVHEGFGFPVVEAMACGLPVVAARAAALPETVADAGLTFVADDAADLARQVARVLDTQQASPVGKGDGGEGFAMSECPSPSPRNPLPTGEANAGRCLKLAVVTPRYGSGFVGGAETSLRNLADSLHRAGNDVTVFTTCAGNGRTSDNDVPERSATSERFAVHRFRTDAVDADRYARAAATIRRADTPIDADEQYALLENSLRSSRLLDALRTQGNFDAIFVGPYLLGLTFDVARAFSDRTIVLPCFHDEPFARLPALREAYESAAGMLYHSAEERLFAEAELGLNHPNAHVLGAHIDADVAGDANRGRVQVGGGRRYLLYCGRYHAEKGLPELFQFAARYCATHPERFTFAFAGRGESAIPAEPWARELGYVDEQTRRDLMAGADALVLLSPNESLSLATLESLAQGTPAIVRAGNDVLEAHIALGQCGRPVDGYDSFAAALDDLWERPEVWQQLGENGCDYVRREFADPAVFASRWQLAIDGIGRPLGDQLRANGLRRANSFDRAPWRAQFARVIERVLDAPPTSRPDALLIRAKPARLDIAVASGPTVIPVRVSNRGRHPETGDGRARTELVSQTLDAGGEPIGPELATPLPGLLLPGQDVAALVRVAVPDRPGQFIVQIRARRPWRGGAPAPEGVACVDITVSLVATECPAMTTNFAGPLLAAQAVQQLPDDYLDVSEGRFAKLKLWVKRKLLHNFQHAYVNALSRQQSAFNRQVLAALAEMADAQTAVVPPARRVDVEVEALREELRDLRRRYRRLARRVAPARARTEEKAA
jgi:glycosyltransferase involved in cell wall biosynthesis